MKEQILALYEIEGLPAAEVARVLEIEEAIVCAVLAAESGVYRANVSGGGKEMEIVPAAVFGEAVKAYTGLAFATQNEFIKEKALRFLINERKGRNDKSDAPAANVVLVQLNQRLQAIGRSRQVSGPVEEEDEEETN